MADLEIGRDETCGRVETWRDAKGLVVSVQAHKAVEEFMKGLGDGTTQPVEMYGKLWGVAKGQDPLLIYTAGEHMFRGPNYRLDVPGRNLLLDGETLNLSFLRIKGVSDGVKFTIRGVHSLDGLVEFNKRMDQALQDIYRNYLKPVNMWIEVTAREF